ncbi:hypothetical protein IJM16_01805 [Candidatus Saccharibacteria bacterium]|nr:hypothetical protein [Candidatus Saccharibacteria bacterium]
MKKHPIAEEVSQKDRVVKIKYDYDYMSENERSSLTSAVIFGVFLILSIIEIVKSPQPSWTMAFLLHTIVILIIFIGVLVFFFVQYFKRKRERELPQKIKANGEKVIGEIVSVNKTNLDKHGENFTYNIEYENPNNGNIAKTIITPSALFTKMYIRKKDLPLKVVVYCYNGMTHVDAVINPPIAKMVFRKFLPYICGIMTVVLFVMAFAAEALNNIPLFFGSLVFSFAMLMLAAISGRR